MSILWVFMVYGCAAALAFVLLYFARAKSWYWHVISVLLALVIGLVPIPPRFNNSQTTLVIGFFFTFLMLWGVAAPFFRKGNNA
jgi:hypothetical protein